jgi:hypothetical protein
MVSRNFYDRLGAALVLGSAVLSLTGCGPQEESDSTPPDPIIKLEKPQGKYRFGVTDTVDIFFTEPVDTSAVAVAIAPSDGLAYRFKTNMRLQIFGTEKSSGVSHFMLSTPFTLTLAGLKDQAGNGQHGEISETFQPYAWVDRDLIDAGYAGVDTLFNGLNNWVDGSPMTDTIVTEGRLDFKEDLGTEDRVDVKIVRIAPPDTLKLALTCAKSLNVKMQVFGPYPENQLEDLVKKNGFTDTVFSGSTLTKGTSTTQVIPDFLVHKAKLEDSDKPGIYAIRLSIPVETEGFYRLGLKLAKYKK